MAVNNPSVQIDDNKKSTTTGNPPPPRRSERLSTAREVTTASQQAVGKSHDPNKLDVWNERNQDIKPVRAIEAGPSRQTIRHRNAPEALPSRFPGPRKASRRLSDEFDDVPTKRTRHNSINHVVIRSQPNHDGRPQEHHNLHLIDFQPTKFTLGFSPYDFSSRGDVLKSPEYVSDIFQRLYYSEVRKISGFGTGTIAL